MDRKGRKVGLKLATSNGKHDPFGYQRMPVDRTALKTASGQSSYSDFQYPYAPVVQDDWSGGRGSLDFERDTTKYNDSHRIRTGVSNKAFLGPQEQHTNGYRGHDYFVPGNVTFVKLSDVTHTCDIGASSSYTVARIWALVRRVGNPTSYPVLKLLDRLNVVQASATLPSTFVTDDLSQWVYVDVSYAVTSGVAYKLQIVESMANPSSTDYWEVAVDTDRQIVPYMRMTQADANQTAIFFEYKEAMHCVLSSSSGAPTVYLNGDRGAADYNYMDLTKLNDATKAWTTNQWTGCIVRIINGNADKEPQPWRKITANDATSLTVDTAWTIAHDVDVEYVILGSNTWQSLGACGLTAPVTSTLIVNDYVMLAQGDAVAIRKLRAYNDAGTWREMTDAANCQADDGTNKAIHLVWTPRGNLIWKSNNNDASGNVSVAKSTAAPVNWGSGNAFAAAYNVGDKYNFIRSLQVYLDQSSNEVVWAFKEDMPWIVPAAGGAYALSLKEMAVFKDKDNGIAALVHNVYLYFPLRVGLQRYYSGQVDDMSINNGESLPAERRGPISAAVGYPGKFFIAQNAGTSGYSAIYDRDSGWHERYRAPKGQSITAMAFQTMPGVTLDRLWFYEGNSILWLPFPSDSTNELKDTAYKYTHEGNLYLTRMHAGMFDVQKLTNAIKLWLDNTTEDQTWIDIFYKLDDDTNWTQIDQQFYNTPTHKVSFDNLYGLAFRRIQLRLRFNTTLATQTPILLASIVEAVMRTEVKYIFKLDFVLDDTDLHGKPDPLSIAERLQILDEWADASSDSMLRMESGEPLYHGASGRMVFINPLTVRTITLEDDKQGRKRRFYYCQTTAQDA